MIRRALVGTALAVVFLGAGAAAATADDVTPPPIPSPSGGASSGPTYVITPGVGGSELPAPSDPEAVEQAKQADQARQARQDRQATQARRAGRAPRAREHGHAVSGLPGSSSPPGFAASAGQQTPLVRPPVPADQVSLGLRGFVAVVAAMVLVEITVVGRYVVGRRVTAA